MSPLEVEAMSEHSQRIHDRRAYFAGRVRALHSEGLTDSLIAQRLSCGANRVADARRRMGLGRNPVAWAGM